MGGDGAGQEEVEAAAEELKKAEEYVAEELNDKTMQVRGGRECFVCVCYIPGLTVGDSSGCQIAEQMLKNQELRLENDLIQQELDSLKNEAKAQAERFTEVGPRGMSG